MEITPENSGSVYSPGETTLVNAAEHGYTKYIGGPTKDDLSKRSIFHNQFEGRYDKGPAELRVYQLDLFYQLLTDREFFEKFMELYGEVLGCYNLDYYGGGHGTIIVDTLTYGFESTSEVPIEETTNRDNWLLNYIQTELASIDSTNLPVLGVAYRARLEERLAVVNESTSDVTFATVIEEQSDGFDLSRM